MTFSLNSISLQVQDAIHAPHINWQSCAANSVYIDPVTGAQGNDQSIPSTLSVLPNVIDKSVRTVIVHGLAVGTLFAILTTGISDIPYRTSSWLQKELVLRSSKFLIVLASLCKV